MSVDTAIEEYNKIFNQLFPNRGLMQGSALTTTEQETLNLVLKMAADISEKQTLQRGSVGYALSNMICSHGMTWDQGCGLCDTKGNAITPKAATPEPITTPTVQMTGQIPAWTPGTHNCGAAKTVGCNCSGRCMYKTDEEHRQASNNQSYFMKKMVLND